MSIKKKTCAATKAAVVAGVVAVSSLALNGCMPTQDVRLERYTLTQSIAPEAYNTTYQVQVQLAPILDQGGVVIQVSDVALRPAKNYRFSAELADELKYLLTDQLLKQDFDHRYSFKILITKFQGTLDGKAIVEFLAQVTDNRSRRAKVVLNKSYYEESAISEDGYAALVSHLKSNYLAALDKVLADVKQGKK